MNPIFKSHMKIIATFVAVIAIVAGVFYLNRSQASINTFTIAPTVLGTDDVVGAEADYDVTYESDSVGTMTTITLTFPEGYTLTDSGTDAATQIQSDLGSGGYITVAGNELFVDSVVPSGQNMIITLTLPHDYSADGSNDTVSFRLIDQITNPTAAGTLTANNFSVTDNATSNEPQQADAGVTIIPGPAVTLDFTTQPSHSPTPDHGDVLSTVSWSTQPVVTAHDEYGNVATSYDGDVVAIAQGTTGIGTLAFPVESPDLCGGPIAFNSYQVAAVAGVADFAGVAGSYIAGEDHDAFNIRAIHTCGTNGGAISENGLSATLTADVVADSLEWSQNPEGCVSGAACATQGTVRAVQLVGSGRGDVTPYLDIDYVGNLKIGEDGAGSLIGNTIQGTMTAGILNTTGIGYTSVDESIDETIHFTAESGSFLQKLSGDVLVAAAGTPPPPPTPPTPSPSPTPSPTPVPKQNPPQQLPIAVMPTASTDGSGACAQYLTAFVRFGSLGEQVIKLQKFLAAEGSYQENVVTGYFGALTEKAVKIFQVKYAAEILTAQGLVAPTGYAKDYTQKKINSLVCQGAVKIS